jgi:ATP-dependent Lon protease
MPSSSQADPDYVPESTTEDTSTQHTKADANEYDDEEDDDEENTDNNIQEIVFYFPPPPRPVPTFVRPSKRPRFEDSLSKEERVYFERLTRDEKKKIIQSNEELVATTSTSEVPLRFKVLNSDMSQAAKRIILTKLDHIQQMNGGSSEYFKLRNWMNAAMRLPLGKYHTLPVSSADPVDKVATFLRDMKHTLDSTVYGHKDTKDQVIRIFAQWISNPGSKGNVIGIHGPMGCGKTSLIKDGICKALNIPFGFIALGGASDGSFLDGHSFTYEGSSYGKIAEVLMKAGVMNPIIFFDELDKISQTSRGEEVTGILMHLTDSSQNEHFADKYFGELELDLSKALIVFSYNDESLVNPILKDRMVTIGVNGYSKKEKITIAQRHLLPALCQQFSIAHDVDVTFSKDVIEYIIQRVAAEDGVRNLKRGLEAILSWINLSRYKLDDAISFPFEVKRAHVDSCIKAVAEPPVIHSMYM